MTNHGVRWSHLSYFLMKSIHLFSVLNINSYILTWTFFLCKLILFSSSCSSLVFFLFLFSEKSKTTYKLIFPWSISVHWLLLFVVIPNNVDAQSPLYIFNVIYPTGLDRYCLLIIYAIHVGALIPHVIALTCIKPICVYWFLSKNKTVTFVGTLQEQLTVASSLIKTSSNFFSIDQCKFIGGSSISQVKIKLNINGCDVLIWWYKTCSESQGTRYCTLHTKNILYSIETQSMDKSKKIRTNVKLHFLMNKNYQWLHL